MPTIPSKVSEIIAHVRRQVSPRTAYATGGKMATILHVIRASKHDTDEYAYGQFSGQLTGTGEFEKINYVYGLADYRSSGGHAGNITLVIVNEKGEGELSEKMVEKEEESNMTETALAYATNLVLDGMTLLTFVLVVDHPSTNDYKAIIEKVELECKLHRENKDRVTILGNQVGTSFLFTCHASLGNLHQPSTDGGSNATGNNPFSLLGSNGQPSVYTKTQFKYLWDKAKAGPRNTDNGKNRVLQRLADHSTSTETSLDKEEWDKVIQQAIDNNQDDFHIYSLIREKTLGRSLEEDLKVNIDCDVSSMEGAKEEAGKEQENEGASMTLSMHSATAASDSADSGRAQFMAKMTMECVPDSIVRRVDKMLDYGCAEGAITAEVGKLLSLPKARVLGADIRTIASDGFTFLPLTEEREDVVPTLNSILPSVKDHTLMLITSAMVMHHVRHVEIVMLELRRVIHDQGVLVLREHHCDQPQMGAFLDITHGLYSLAWSEPVEWPKFIQEYTAWYRSQEQWDEMMFRCGFTRITDNTRIQRHYDNAKRSHMRSDGKITNLIKAYYASYRPTPNFQISNAIEQVMKKRNIVRKTDDSVDKQIDKVINAPNANMMWAAPPPSSSTAITTNTAHVGNTNMMYAAPAASTDNAVKRSREEMESSKSVSESKHDKRLAASPSLPPVALFESRSNRGFFYLVDQGKSDYVSLFLLKDVDSGKKLPVFPAESTIPAAAHPIAVDEVAFIRNQRVHRVKSIAYAAKK